MGFEEYFSIQVFFLILRETLETAIIVSVLLAFLKQSFKSHDESSLHVYRKLVIQVWVGAGVGLLICCLLGALFILIFYTVGTNLWSFTEKIWEATFSIISSIIITFMGLALLRVNKMKEKWKVKLAKLIIERHSYQSDDNRQCDNRQYQDDSHDSDCHNHKLGIGRYVKFLSKKYAMAILPMVTTLREGLEAVVFLGGIGITQPMSSFPLAAVAGIVLGCAFGMVLYRFGDHVSMKYFMVGATCFLYLVASGLFSRGVWFIDLQRFVSRVGQDVSESGSGPGSYNINWSVWHVNCCNPQTDGPWMLFNALMGWQNSPTINSVISYNLYWLAIIVIIFCLKYKDKYGYMPWSRRRFHKRKEYQTLSDNTNAQNISRATSLVFINEISNAQNTEQQINGDLSRQVRPSHDSINSSTPLVR